MRLPYFALKSGRLKNTISLIIIILKFAFQPFTQA